MAVVEQRWRIGELARRTGTTPELLRAWEHRYGLFEPARTTGGYRLYSALDEQRVLGMRTQLAAGLSAAQAARALRRAPAAGDALRELEAAFDAFDAAAADEVLDRLVAARPVAEVVLDVVLPVLRAMGERWDTAEHGIAREHFASSLLRGRLLALGRGWDTGDGPRAVLACPPGERHDLGLVSFGLALREHGWRITLLGADAPVATVARTAAMLDADAVVLAAIAPRRFRAAGLAELGEGRRLAIGGPGARRGDATALGAELLEGDPVVSAASVAQAR